MLMPPEGTVQQALGLGSLDSWKKRVSRDSDGGQESPRDWKVRARGKMVCCHPVFFEPVLLSR